MAESSSQANTEKENDCNVQEELIYRDPINLHSFDHSGMILVSACLVGMNYRSWSRAMRIVLGAKQKLEFIDNTVKVPEIEYRTYKIYCGY